MPDTSAKAALNMHKYKLWLQVCDAHNAVVAMHSKGPSQEQLDEAYKRIQVLHDAWRVAKHYAETIPTS